MFGNNPKRMFESGDGQTLKIQNIFLTFQGEGPYAGKSSIFIRLGGCNLSCDFCDTEFETFKEMSLEQIIDEVLAQTKDTKCSLAVITGGEPFRQNINLLCQQLMEKNFAIQIESNGTLFTEVPDGVEVVCSPKISKNKYYGIRGDIKYYIIAYKFLVSKYREGYDKLPEWDFHGRRVYVQPIDEYDELKNLENIKLAMDIAHKYGYIFSPQMHKYVGIE